MQRKPSLILFEPQGDVHGWLVAVEGLKDVPFEIKRIFYIYGSMGDVVRGQHANRRSDIVIINVCGECKVRTDNGCGEIEVFQLKNPNEGIYIPRFWWKDMYDFSEDNILLCLASERYDSKEYIRDYDAYSKEMKGYQSG